MSATASPGPAELIERAELFGTLFVLTGRITTRMDRALAGFGLTTRQWLLLAVLDNQPAGTAPTLTEAAAAYGSSRQNVKAIAEQLAARGWLRLERDPADRRATRLHLTGRIEDVRRPEARRSAEELLDAVFGPLDRDDIHTMHAAVGRWLAALPT